MITMTEIQQITEHCMKLLSCTEYLRRDVTTKEANVIAEEIFGSLRKMFIASMMYDKKLICISGLQGAGKTTLMRNFYHLDGKFLDPNRGRGERIPVLITEKKDISYPEMCAIRIDKDVNGNYFKQKVELLAEDYLSVSKGEDVKIMYLELFVPWMHTENEGISFVLLPGFEKKNDYWNNLIEFSVNSSDAAVFVFNETSFSNADNDKYLSRIENRFGKNLVYAISGADGSPDDNAAVRKTCIETLNIPVDEEDRVVCVGSYTNEEKNNAWINMFKNALEKYAYKETQQFQRNSGYLYDEVRKISDDLYRILGILNDDNTAEIKEHKDDALIKAFNMAREKKRKEILAHLDTCFETAIGISKAKLEDLFSGKPKSKGLKKLLFGSGVREQYTETREIIRKSLVEEDDVYLPDKYLAIALKNSLEMLDHSIDRTEISRLVDRERENNRVLLPDGDKSQALRGDICSLLADHSQSQPDYMIQSKNPKNIMKAIVEIGTYYFSLISYDMAAEHAGLGYYEPADTQLNSGKILEGMKSSQKFIAGIAGMMGIDLIGDNTINMVSQIAESLGVAAPVAGAATVAIIGAGAASAIMKDLNRMQREDFRSACLVVDSIYDNMKIDALNKYDAYMEKIRDRIEDNLTEISGDTKKVFVEHNAKVQINNALSLLNRIQERYMGDVYGLGSAFS